MSEGNLWKDLRPLLAGLDPVRIESHDTDTGIPDVNITLGWIELKYMREWPKRATTPLRVDHFTVEQRAWLTRRWAAGGSCWVILKVGADEWLLFRGYIAALYLGQVARNALYGYTLARWVRKPKKEEIQSCLKS